MPQYPLRQQPKHSGSRSVLGIWAVLLYSLLFAASGTAADENNSASAQRLRSLTQEIADDYADVTHISVATYKADYADALVVDVRTQDEFERSHLPGALHAPTAQEIDVLRQQYPARDLVFYCTVGVRSSLAVRGLLAREAAARESTDTQGPADLGAQPESMGRVVNLAGSIFAWANQGEPLVNSSGPTRAVHPFNAWWGFRYLDSDRP